MKYHSRISEDMFGMFPNVGITDASNPTFFGSSVIFCAPMYVEESFNAYCLFEIVLCLNL